MTTSTSNRMRAVLMKPEDVLNEPHDHRDHFSKAQQLAALEDLDRWHQRALGGDVPRLNDAIKRYLVSLWYNKINIVSGLRGSGKTICAVDVAALQWMIGGLVFSNIGLRFGYRLQGASIFGLSRLPYGSLIILDEAPFILNKYTQNTVRQREAVGGLAGFRKRGLSLIMPTSQESNFGIDVKAETDFVLYPQQRKSGLPTTEARHSRTPGRRGRGDYVSPAWAHLVVHVVGPRPWRGQYVGENFGLQVSGPKPKVLRAFPDCRRIEHVAKLYGSFADIPDRESAGNTVTASEMHRLRMGEDFVLGDVVGEDGVSQETEAWQERYRQLLQLLWERWIERHGPGVYALSNVDELVGEELAALGRENPPGPAPWGFFDHSQPMDGGARNRSLAFFLKRVSENREPVDVSGQRYLVDRGYRRGGQRRLFALNPL